MKIAVNEHILNLSENYLFTEMKERISAKKFIEGDLVDLGIGDVSLPLPAAAVREAVEAAKGMAELSTFHGYGPENGHEFLRDAVARYYACDMGAAVSPDDIFICDGAKSAIFSVLSALGDAEVLIPDPAYPAYADCAAIAGKKVSRLRVTENEGFIPVPSLPKTKPYVIFLCSPDNPTGTVMPRDIMQAWVDFAMVSGSLIVFDSAYERFVKSDAYRSIYCIPGAELCSIEVGSLSKSAGFTGMRCGWVIVPEKLMQGNVSVRRIWRRRVGSCYNGTSYVVQRAAYGALSDEGRRECVRLCDYYLNNAAILKQAFSKSGYTVFGGTDSPYLWINTGGMSSWRFFDHMLDKAGIALTPGCGFGECGEGYVRISALCTMDSALLAAERMGRI